MNVVEELFKQVMKMKCKIGEIIDNKGYKKKWIAGQMEVSPTQLSNWISGRSYPPMDKAFKLAKFLNCKVDDLYEYD